MTFGERLIYARNMRGYSQKALAELLDITPTRLNYWEKDKRQPDVLMVWKIISALRISGNWLIGEEGNIEIETASAEQSSEGDIQKTRLIKNYDRLNSEGKEKLTDYSEDLSGNPKYTESVPEQRYRTIKYFYQPASAGYGEWIDNDSYDDFDIPDIPEYAAADFAVKVDGDSMLPDYEDGDIVLVHSQDTTLDGVVGVWWVEGEGTFIKELRKGSLFPHNKEYSAITLRGKDWRCYGRVIAKLDSED